MRCVSALLAIGLAACGGGDKPADALQGDATPSVPVLCDVDGDGFLARYCAEGSDGADCDDADPTSHPGASEALDGADNDCDGVVDEGTEAWDHDGDCVCVAATCTGSNSATCQILRINS